MDTPPPEALALLRELRSAFIQGDWTALRATFAHAQFSIKGSATTVESFQRFLHVRQFMLTDLVLERVLDLRARDDALVLTGRYALIGQRGKQASRDGIICDATLSLARSGALWLVTSLHAVCPPEHALWHNRPNAEAPIDYADASASDGDALASQGIVAGCPWRWRADA